MRRRDALKTLGALAGTAYASRLLSACGSSSGAGRIDTIVYMMMENRSYDHFLGSRSLVEGLGGDGLLASMSNLDGNGQAVPVFVTPDNNAQLCVANDPPHGWDDSRLQFGAGANNGFVLAHEGHHGIGAIEPMAYLLRDQIPVTHALADSYTSCDRWFSSVLGGTLPNRMYWHAGTSNSRSSGDLAAGLLHRPFLQRERRPPAAPPAPRSAAHRRYLPGPGDLATVGKLPPRHYLRRERRLLRPRGATDGSR